MYEMTTISNGTRIRTDHNTASSVIGDVPANVKLTGDELFVATLQLSNANGVYQFVGDKWLKTSYNGIVGWVAHIHKGQLICKDFRQVDTLPNPNPVFPTSFILTNPDGNSAEYEFIRILP